MGTHSKKRKRAVDQSDSARPSKKSTPTHQPQSSVPTPSDPPPAAAAISNALGKSTRPQPASIGPHASVVSALEPKYSVFAPSVLPATKIRTRITQILAHLLPGEDSADKAKETGGDASAQTEKDGPGKPAVVLLHARVGSVCKMITIAEQVKRLVAAKGGKWWQYNEMFEPMPKEEKKNAIKDSGEPTREEHADDDEDGFEVMQPITRLEKAIVPQKEERTERSLRVFLSILPVPELKARPSVTVQTNAETRGAG